MITAIIIDDEIQDQIQLLNLIERYCRDKVKVLHCADDYERGIESIVQYKPQLVFLDVALPRGKTGFDILRHLYDRSISVQTIFTTNYGEHILKAFEFSAIDYLMKPVPAERLVEAVRRAEERVSQELMFKKMKSLLDFLNKRPGSCLAITSKETDFVSLDDIIRCQAEINYTHFFLNDKRKMLSCKTLGDYEKLLSDFGFFRVHQSHLINTKHVVRFYHNDQGGIAKLSDGSSVDVAARRKAAFLKHIKGLAHIKFA